MLSLRAIARAAPRTAPRFASFTSKTAFRPSLQTAFRSARPSVAAFSTSRSRFDEHSQHLAAKLTSEIDLESEESSVQTGSDSNVQQFRDENPDWTIEDKEGEHDVILRRKYDDEDITVHFSIADFNNPMMPMEDDMDGALADEEDMDVQSHGGNTKGAINAGRTSGGNFKQAPEDSIAPADREDLQDEDDVPPSYAVDVNVLIQRPGNKGALRFNAVADNGEFIIQHIIHVPASQASGDAVDILRNSNDNTYAGPPFQQLDEEVQGLLEAYLNARGITSHMATFIPDYVDVKEQKEYVSWLGRVKEFVE